MSWCPHLPILAEKSFSARDMRFSALFGERMSKKQKMKTAIQVWFDHFIMGVSMSLLASGIVSTLMMGNEKIAQNTVLITVSLLGLMLSFLMSILPHLLAEE